LAQNNLGKPRSIWNSLPGLITGGLEKQDFESDARFNPSFLLSEANLRVIFLLSGKLLEFDRIAVGGLVGFWSGSSSSFQGGG